MLFLFRKSNQTLYCLGHYTLQEGLEKMQAIFRFLKQNATEFEYMTSLDGFINKTKFMVKVDGIVQEYVVIQTR